MTEATASSEYIPKVLVFVYHNGDIESYTFTFTNNKNDTSSIKPKKIVIHKKLACFLVEYNNNEERVRYVTVSNKNSQDNLKYTFYSTIIEIKLYDSSQDEKGLFNDIVNLETHENVKILFKFATSKLKTQTRIAENPLLHYLFNIQPNGRILSPKELLEFAKEFIVWLPSLIETMKKEKTGIFFYTEYIYFMFRKFLGGQIFGATALFSVLYHQKDNKELIDAASQSVKDKINQNTFSLPIDLVIDDIEFAEENLNLISQNIITCNDAYLAFLAGYQVCLHSKFMEITNEWLEDVESIDIDQFAIIFCSRINATFMGREFLEFPNETDKGNIKITNDPDLVIQKFVEFSKIFLKGNEKNVESALRNHKNEYPYVTDEIISKLHF